MITKICPRPGCIHGSQPQDTSNFTKAADRPDGLGGWCKDCRKQHRLENLEKITIQQKRSKYPGLPRDLAESLFRGEVSCSICGSSGDLRIDHCHETGKFRSILCHRCNIIQGLAREDPMLLELHKQYAEFCQKFKDISNDNNG